MAGGFERLVGPDSSGRDRAVGDEQLHSGTDVLKTKKPLPTGYGGLRPLFAETMLMSNPERGQFRSFSSNWDQEPPPIELSKIRMVRIWPAVKV